MKRPCDVMLGLGNWRLIGDGVEDRQGIAQEDSERVAKGQVGDRQGTSKGQGGNKEEEGRRLTSDYLLLVE